MEIKKSTNKKIILIYTCCLVIIYIFCKYLGFTQNIVDYFTFSSNSNLDFHDLLSIMLTILSIFIGAIITVATVLISMCDKRIMKLIKRYNQQYYVIHSIKISLLCGIVTVVIFSIIYAGFDFNIKIVRYTLLYISGANLFLFARNSSLSVRLILNILDNSFDEVDSLVQDIKFKMPSHNYKDNDND